MTTAGGQHIITNDGVKIAYERLGKSGPVVVLLHGNSLNNESHVQQEQDSSVKPFRLN
jgi:hypothetical protein